MTGISFKAFQSSSPNCGCPGNKKGFNGNEIQNKEFSDGSGLEMYDFNARTYYQQIGRFIQIDTLSEEGDQESLSPYQFSGNNPSTFNDPDGKCPSCVGAIVGAVVDVGLQLTEIALTDKPLSQFSFTSVVVSGAAGAVGVGIASKIDKAVKIANITSGVVKTAIKVGANAATDATISAASQKVKTGEVNTKEVLLDAVAGGTIGRIAGDIAGKAAKSSSTGQVLARQANRAERIAANSTRKARLEATVNATEKAENYIASRVATASTASSAVSSDAAKKKILKR